MLRLVRYKNVHGRESAGCAENGDSVRKLFGAIIRGSRCLARAIVVKELLNDDLLGVVTSRQVEKVENIYTILLQIYSGNNIGPYQISSESSEFYKRYYRKLFGLFFPDTV